MGGKSKIYCTHKEGEGKRHKKLSIHKVKYIQREVDKRKEREEEKDIERERKRE